LVSCVPATARIASSMNRVSSPDIVFITNPP
jgi:hypothetical protein